MEIYFDFFYDYKGNNFLAIKLKKDNVLKCNLVVERILNNKIRELKYAKDKKTIDIVFNGNDPIGLCLFRLCSR